MATDSHSSTLHVGDAETMRLRFAVSPLATVAVSLFATVTRSRARPSDDWTATLRERARRLDLGPLALFGAGRPVPHFLLPVPTAGRRTFAAELEALRATPAPVVARGLAEEFGAEVPAAYAELQRSPRAGIRRYCAALAEFWRVVLAPSWGRISQLVEREVLLAGGRLATGGLPDVIDGLHPSLRLDDGALSYPAARDTEIALDDRPLVLVPVVGPPDRILRQEDHRDAAWLGYVPPGIAELRGEAPPDPAAELVTLLGPTRAGLLAGLRSPDTTTGLAQRHFLAPSTVSHHLSALSCAGLVEATRVACAVLYRASERGSALLELFDQPA